MKMWLDNFKKRNYFGIKQQNADVKKKIAEQALQYSQKLV